jgi:hypothetical protein
MQNYTKAQIIKIPPSSILYKTYGVKLIVFNSCTIKVRAPNAASAEIITANTISIQFIDRLSKPKE